MGEAAWAKALGVFSLALGGVELAAPAWLGRAAGVTTRPGVVRLHGAREVLAGLLVLSTRFRRTGLWSRVAGDALDLATLAAGARPWTGRAGAAAGMVLGVTALDVACAVRT